MSLAFWGLSLGLAAFADSTQSINLAPVPKQSPGWKPSDFRRGGGAAEMLKQKHGPDQAPDDATEEGRQRVKSASERAAESTPAFNDGYGKAPRPGGNSLSSFGDNALPPK